VLVVVLVIAVVVVVVGLPVLWLPGVPKTLADPPQAGQWHT
jgi:hypothetical protein